MWRRTNKPELESGEERSAWLLLAPTMVVMLLFVFYPLGMVLSDSLTDKAFASKKEATFVGLDNYVNMLALTVKKVPPQRTDDGALLRDEQGRVVYQRPSRVLPRSPRRYHEWFGFSLFGSRYTVGASDKNFYSALADTLLFTLVAVFLETALGLLIALLLHQKFRGRGWMRAALLVPWAIPTAVSSRMWEWMFHSSRIGLFNSLFSALGWSDGQTAFLTLPAWQLPIMIFIDVWKTTPFMALLLLAGLQMIPDGLYEAARIDGAGTWVRFRRLTLPLLMPVMSTALIFRTLDSLRVFDLFQIVYGQSRYSLSSYSYYTLLNSRDAGYASALGVVIFLLLLAVARFYMKKVGVER